jgi:hypothetical protein
MITEEALPTYMAMLNTLDGVRDETGASPTPWAAWTRLWTAEENRHGDLMNKYIYLTGRSVFRQYMGPGGLVARQNGAVYGGPGGTGNQAKRGYWDELLVASCRSCLGNLLGGLALVM